MTRARARLSWLLYNTVLVSSLPLLPVYLGLRARSGKRAVGLAERSGRMPPSMAPRSGRRVWFHAASVGEVMAVTPVVRALADRVARCDCVLTVVTPGGYEVAQALVGKSISGVAYAPVDFPSSVRKAARTIRPDVYVGVETEIWPNVLNHVTASGARAVLINGRLSDRSYPRYRRARWFTAWPLSRYEAILTQSGVDTQRFIAIGAPPDRVETLGNAKFDQADEPLGLDEIRALKAELQIAPEAPVWVVGSTRVIEEETLVWEAYLQARKTVPNLVLIHAPRHVDRADAMMVSMRQRGLDPVRRTQIDGMPSGNATVLVLDTFGELGRIYALASAAFVGNSLVAPGGGQNPLQPLAQGVPVIYGPYMANFRDAVAMAEQARLGTQVRSSDELCQSVLLRLREASHAGPLRERALALIAENRGAAARYAERIASLLPAA